MENYRQIPLLTNTLLGRQPLTTPWQSKAGKWDLSGQWPRGLKLVLGASNHHKPFAMSVDVLSALQSYCI